MNYLNNKKILLIICGGISAYKSLDLIRLLKKNGSSVKTILTKSAEKFVTPLSVVSLSQEKIYTDIFDYNNEAEMDHISLSRWADIVLIVPATANTIAKLSNGIADDLATTVVLASNKKIFLAPAMNVRMWEHVSNKHNVQKIREFGYNVIGPDIGDMACGEYGEGKMSSVEDIFNEIKTNNQIRNPELATQDAIHPVIITHPESGKKALYVNPSFTIGIEGWSKEESRALLDFLYSQAVSEENITRFKWKKDSIAFWDNRCTWHYALNDYPGKRRLMHRITVEGSEIS